MSVEPDLDATVGDVPVLDVRAISKVYGAGAKEHVVLDDFSLRVWPQELVSIVGPSGAGKTTLLRCLSGLTAPTSGEVRLHGNCVSGPPDDLAVVFQDYSRSLMPWLKVMSNVTLPLRRKKMSRDKRRHLATEMLGAVNLSEAGDKYPWQLSGGMQQRVAIARALAYRPSVLLMDEPFASLDAQTRSELEDLVLRLRSEFDQTVVFVTHDIDEAVYLSDRVAVLGGTPTTVRDVLDIDLPSERNQVATKSMHRFAELRAHVIRLIQSSARPPESEEI